MDYIKSIRKDLGSRKIILNCAGAIIEKDGKILLQRRSDNNRWGLIGGLMELNETYEDTALREIREETRLEVRLTSFLGIFHNHNMIWSNGDRAHTVGAYYTADIVSGEPKTDAESLELRFFSPLELPELFAEDHREAVKAYTEGRRLPLPKENRETVDPSNFSKRYSVRKLTEKDIPAVLELCRKNTVYYEYCPPFVTAQTIKDNMYALPPTKSFSDKYYVGYFDGQQLIAVMDFIRAFPNAYTAFLGFFMMERSLQNQGIGSSIIEEICTYLKDFGMSHIRLGWVKGNLQSEHFWLKNSFQKTGVSYETDGYTVIVAERCLTGKEFQ